jgi:hypothetical protein
MPRSAPERPPRGHGPGGAASRLSGLVREIQEADGFTLERVDRAGVWVDDPNLIRHWVDPGDSQLVAIDKREAAEIASAYAVEL